MGCFPLRSPPPILCSSKWGELEGGQARGRAREQSFATTQSPASSGVTHPSARVLGSVSKIPASFPGTCDHTCSGSTADLCPAIFLRDGIAHPDATRSRPYLPGRVSGPSVVQCHCERLGERASGEPRLYSPHEGRMASFSDEAIPPVERRALDGATPRGYSARFARIRAIISRRLANLLSQ